MTTRALCLCLIFILLRQNQGIFVKRKAQDGYYSNQWKPITFQEQPSQNLDEELVVKTVSNLTAQAFAKTTTRPILESPSKIKNNDGLLAKMVPYFILSASRTPKQSNGFKPYYPKVPSSSINDISSNPEQKPTKSWDFSNCYTKTCDQIITGRQLKYRRALEILQNEEYLHNIDLRQNNHRVKRQAFVGNLFNAANFDEATVCAQYNQAISQGNLQTQLNTGCVNLYFSVGCVNQDAEPQTDPCIVTDASTGKMASQQF